MTKIFDKIIDVIQTIIGIMLGVMIIIMFLQVIFRYVIHSSIIWSEEASRYLQYLIVMIGTVAVVYTNIEIRVDLLEKALKGLAKKLLTTFIFVVRAFLTGVLVYASYLFASQSKETVSAAMHLPMGYMYAVMCVTFGMCFLITIYQCIKLWMPVSPGADTANPSEQ